MPPFGYNQENGVFSLLFTYFRTIQNILVSCWLYRWLVGAHSTQHFVENHLVGTTLGHIRPLVNMTFRQYNVWGKNPLKWSIQFCLMENHFC